MRVNRYDRWKILHFKFPNRFRRAKFFHHINSAHFFDALGQYLRRAADRVQINAAVFLARRKRAVAHAALADDAADAEIANDLRLIRLFTDGSSRAGGSGLPIPLLILHHDRTAMIKNSVAQLYFRRQHSTLVHILVNRVAPGEHDTGNQNLVANFQSPDFFFGKWKAQFRHGSLMIVPSISKKQIKKNHPTPGCTSVAGLKPATETWMADAPPMNGGNLATLWPSRGGGVY